MTPGQIRGMLLEEAVLHLLRRSGYQTVDDPGTDPTLCTVGAGLAVHGRGCDHQIDAIADFNIHPPFSNPQRLLVEAKCFNERKHIGIDVVRNAVGVLKDASEFWVAGRSALAGRVRYHYQYAVFSATTFSSVAQRYAFAQDVYLFPLNRSRYFRPILNAIRRLMPDRSAIGRQSFASPHQLSRFRSSVREALRAGEAHPEIPRITFEFHLDVQAFLEACWGLRFALVGVLGGRFPVLLSPSEAVRDGVLEDRTRVRIFWNENGWFIGGTDNEILFSFDLPDELFELYAKDGFLSPGRALDLKEEIMNDFQVIEMINGRARLISFALDNDWIASIRNEIVLK